MAGSFRGTSGFQQTGQQALRKVRGQGQPYAPCGSEGRAGPADVPALGGVGWQGCPRVVPSGGAALSADAAPGVPGSGQTARTGKGGTRTGSSASGGALISPQENGSHCARTHTAHPGRAGEGRGAVPGGLCQGPGCAIGLGTAAAPIPPSTYGKKTPAVPPDFSWHSGRPAPSSGGMGCLARATHRGLTCGVDRPRPAPSDRTPGDPVPQVRERFLSRFALFASRIATVNRFTPRETVALGPRRSGSFHRFNRFTGQAARPIPPFAVRTASHVHSRRAFPSQDFGSQSARAIHLALGGRRNNGPRYPSSPRRGATACSRRDLRAPPGHDAAGGVPAVVPPVSVCYSAVLSRRKDSDGEDRYGVCCSDAARAGGARV
jgi:hypothetical protein